jgi:8-oxo-dGTP diphosphatase
MKKRVRAIIVEGRKILLIKRTFPDHVYWVFPGGGAEDGETVIDALKRECLEELGVTVEVTSLFMKKISEKEETKGEMEYFYIASITDGKFGNASGPEYKTDSHYKGTYELVWEDISKIKDIDLRPNDVRDKVFINI